MGLRETTKEPVTQARQNSQAATPDAKCDPQSREYGQLESSGRSGKRDRVRRRREKFPNGRQEADGAGNVANDEASHQSVYHQRLSLFNKVDRGDFDFNSGDVKTLVENLLHGSEAEPDTLLHHWIDYLRSRDAYPDVEEGFPQLASLATFALQLDPSLLKEPRWDSELTPLQWAIEKRMDYLTDYLCDVSERLVTPGAQMNACEEAIHYKKDGQTCLHYAIVKGFPISRSLVEFASAETLLEGSGPLNNTPLHEAVYFGRLGSAEWWLDLVKAIVRKEPQTLLKLNNSGHSPYRYHVITAKDMDAERVNNGEANAKDGEIVNEKEADEKDTNQGQPSDIVPKDDLGGLGNTRRSGHVAKGNLSIIDPGKSSARKLSIEESKLQRDQAAEIKDLLHKCCLDYRGHQEAFTGLWGSIEGNRRTWINLLNVELTTQFEDRLRYRKLDKELGFVGVRVPADLNSYPNQDQPTSNHLIVRFFTWLRDTKNVSEILKVVVRDDAKNPCSDEVIEKSLAGFKVRYLDWDREDLSSGVVQETVGDIRGLSLYWSGNDAVLREWYALRNIGTLREIYLTAQRKWDSLERTKDNIEAFKLILYASHKLVTGGDIPPRRGTREGQGREQRPIVTQQNKIHQWFKKIETFTEGLGDPTERNPEMASVKVAIIDDGVDPNGEYIIGDGTSYSFPSNPYDAPPEYFPSTLGHGTAMAKIIYRVCPSARLYAAKLNETTGRRRFSMKYAAKAIQWAVDSEVHIISMSWTIDKALESDIGALKAALDNARTKGIILFCAARDEGLDSNRPVYPYECAKDIIIRIGATDEFGTALTYVEKDIDYLLPGKELSEISTRLEGVHKDDRNIGEGSSEATALAAGLAALVLVCFGGILGEKGIKEVKDPARMKSLFDTFAAHHNPYVLPWIFQEAASKAKPAENEFVDQPTEIRKRMLNLIALCRSILSNPTNPKPKIDPP